MKSEGIIAPDWFVDSFYDNVSFENFAAILEQLPAGVSEIMCHPGRPTELEVLTDKRVSRKLDSLGLRLVDYKIIVNRNGP